ncbi:MAG: hypothetical protein ACREPL_15345, partial [Rhodanobacteraceae bacterium]
HDGFGNVVLPKLPSVLADRAPARTRTSLCADLRALLARSAAMLGGMQRRDFRSDDRPSLACVDGASGIRVA